MQPDGTLVAVAGILESVKAAKEIKGTSPKCVRQDNPSGYWSMWVQDIIVQDATGKIKVGIKLDDPTFAFHDGMLRSPISAEGEKSSYQGKFALLHEIKKGTITHAAAAVPAPPPHAPPNAAQNAAAINQAYQGGYAAPTPPAPAQAPPAPPQAAPSFPQLSPEQMRANIDAEERKKVWGMCFHGLVCACLKDVSAESLIADMAELQALDGLANMCIDGVQGANPQWVGEEPPPPTDEVPF